MELRRQTYREYDRRESTAGANYRVPDNFSDAYAPYLPVIIEACQEDELAYEYRHGAESFGAFTFHLAKAARESKVKVTKLLRQVSEKLEEVGYSQFPAWLGPKERLKYQIFDRPTKKS